VLNFKVPVRMLKICNSSTGKDQPILNLGYTGWQMVKFSSFLRKADRNPVFIVWEVGAVPEPVWVFWK